MINGKIAFAALAFASAFSALFAAETKYELSDFRNYLGTGWFGTAEDTLQYARNVGHTHVMYMHGMEKLPLARGMNFSVEFPEFGTYRRTIDTTKKYSEEQIKEWLEICAVLYPEKPFPECMACGWFFSATQYSLQPDMQQKRVHEIIIKRAIENVKKIEARNSDFKFIGFSWDVPHPGFKKFNPKSNDLNSHTNLTKLRGVDSLPDRAGIVHDYPTYFAGYSEFYRAIMEAARKINPEAKYIVEPYTLYTSWNKFFENDYFKNMKPEQVAKYKADFVMAEGAGTSFALDERNFKDGWLKENMVASSNPSVFLESEMRAEAVAAATNGAWTCFFGRYGGYNTAPLARTIRDIPARIKLGKLVAVWENLNNTPLSQRKYENGVYSSPTAYMSADAYWAKQPDRDRIIVVFNSERGKVVIPDKYEIERIDHLDGLFAECGKERKGVLKRNGNTISTREPCVQDRAFAVKVKLAEKAGE